MTIRVLRIDGTADRTVGLLVVDGHFLCYTLEDTLRPRGVKVPAQTAIAPGRYLTQVTMSARFHRPLPVLLDVPQFEGIRFHGGNTHEDTKGCLLVGIHRGLDNIFNCAPALEKLMTHLEEGLRAGPVWCSVENVL